MTQPPFTPDKAQIAALEPFERLPLERIELVATAAQAERAIAELSSATTLGFDTESKPTFAKGEISDGPHIVQLATLSKARTAARRCARCSHRTRRTRSALVSATTCGASAASSVSRCSAWST
jgi:hypothetical protein